MLGVLLSGAGVSNREHFADNPDILCLQLSFDEVSIVDVPFLFE